MASDGGGSKLYVPNLDSGGESAETKARDARRLMTHVAIRVVQGHLGGLGNDGGFAPQASSGSVGLRPRGSALGDGERAARGRRQLDQRVHEEESVVALRVLEARKAYCEEFDYQQMRSGGELIDSGNMSLMRSTRTSPSATTRT